MADKHELSFGHLPKVEELLKTLGFLEYATPLRNLCYDLQYLFFLDDILANDIWYGGFKNKLMYERLKACFTCCEGLLYLALKQAAQLGEQHNQQRFPVLCQTAEDTALISAGTHRQLANLRRLRNKHHPSSQRDLHVKLASEAEHYNYQFTTKLITELKSTLHPH